MRTGVLGLLAAAAAAAVALPLGAFAGPGSSDLPDLISQPAERPILSVYGDGRLLLRFDGFVSNSPSAGSALEIRASGPQGVAPAEHYMTTVQQWGGVTSPGVGGNPVPNAAGGPPIVRFETADDHLHYHLKDAAEYSLWNADRTAQVAVAQKTDAGFCLEDSQNIGGPGPSMYKVTQSNFCGEYDQANPQPAPNPLVMGISRGWRDLYHRDLTYQWVDVTAVQPGVYQLASRVDPKNVIRESDESNPYAFLPGIVIPGHVAKAVTVPQAGQPVAVPLESDTFGAPAGARQFRIATAPAHGSLNVPVGAVVPAASVTYTPKPGYLGSDSFGYVAVTEGSPYPSQPQVAAVSLAGNTVSVAISGAPARLRAGTSAQLSATVVNAPSGVTWSVNGVPGGNAQVGTITPAGLYVAPKSPPPGGVATIRATSSERPDAFAEAAVTIARAGAQKPAPSVGGVDSAGKRLLSDIGVRTWKARGVIAKVVTGRMAGRVVITATVGRRVIDRCAARVGPRSSVICRVEVPRRTPRSDVRLTARFTSRNGKATAVRRAWAAPARTMSKPAPRRSGRVVVTTVRPSANGRLVVSAVVPGRGTVARCSTAAVRGSVASCRLTLPAGVRPASVRIVARLRAADGTILAKSSRLR